MSKSIAVNKTRSASLLSVLFIAANIGLPHLFHLIPGGGIMFLPIYFFTAFAAVCYGKWTGILTGIMSPLAGYMIFGAPKWFMIPDMILKGVLLSSFIVYALTMVKRNLGQSQGPTMAQLAAIPVAVLMAWAVAGVLELAIRDYEVAFQDFFTGVPGLMMMTVGGWIALFFNKRIAQ